MAELGGSILKKLLASETSYIFYSVGYNGELVILAAKLFSVVKRLS